jgi:uncharacterized protein YqhQ
MKTEFKAEYFVNEFGQVIYPGEEVFFMGTSRKITSMCKGVFNGVRYGDVSRTEHLKNPDGSYIYKEVEYYGRTVNRHVSKTTVTREVVSVSVTRYCGKKRLYERNELGKYEIRETDEDVYSTSTLKQKRVYKLSTELSMLAGKSF